MVKFQFVDEEKSKVIVEKSVGNKKFLTEKADTKLNFDTGKKSKDSRILDVSELEKMNIDDVSFHYRQFTGKKRIHKKDAITTKNYMIDEIIKVLIQNKEE